MEKDQRTLRELYAFICKQEGIKKLPIKYKRVGKGGACLVFMTDRRTGKKTPLHIEVDLSRICCGPLGHCATKLLTKFWSTPKIILLTEQGSKKRRPD